jgi:homogentisate 1,2-dioxygenase
LTHKIEANFSSTNENVRFVPQAMNWMPFPIPPARGPEIDFVQGLKTIAGHGDSTTKEGVAIHIYAASASMKKKAFCSCDGDMLLMPQTGRLDIQTEFGR